MTVIRLTAFLGIPAHQSGGGQDLSGITDKVEHLGHQKTQPKNSRNKTATAATNHLPKVLSRPAYM